MTYSNTSPQRGARRGCRRLLLGLAAVVALGIAAFVLWWTRDVEPQDAILATSTPRPQARLFAVDVAESALGVSIESPLGEVDGGYDMSGGTVELDREGDGWRLFANLTFDARTLHMGNDVLSGLMRRALNVEEYPNGIFIAQSETLLTDLDAAQTVNLTGQLELHGSVVDYTIPTRVEITGERMALAAELVIDPGEFGVSMPSMAGGEALDADLRVVAYETAPSPE